MNIAKTKKRIISLLLNVFANHRNMILYFCIGLSAAAMDLIVYLILFNLGALSAEVSTAISVSIATIFGFVMNIIFNFKMTDKLLLRFLSYSSVSGVGIILSIVMLYLFHTKLAFDGNVVKIASMPVIFLTQYLLNKTISFKKTKQESQNISN